MERVKTIYKNTKNVLSLIKSSILLFLIRPHIKYEIVKVLIVKKNYTNSLHPTCTIVSRFAFFIKYSVSSVSPI